MVNMLFGLKVVVFGIGVVFNNEMDDFLIVFGVVNVFGLVGVEVNVVEVFKCFFLSMSLMIILCDGEFVMICGVVGGLKIIM